MNFKGDYDEALHVMKYKIKPLICNEYEGSFVQACKCLATSLDHGQEVLHGGVTPEEFSMYQCYRKCSSAVHYIYVLYCDLIGYSNTLYENFLSKKNLDSEGEAGAFPLNFRFGNNTQCFEINNVMGKLSDLCMARTYDRFIIDLESVPSAADYVEEYVKYGNKIKEVYSTVKDYYTSILDNVEKWSIKEEFLNTINSIEYYIDDAIETIYKIVFIFKKTIEKLCENDVAFKRELDDMTRRLSRMETPFDGLPMAICSNISNESGTE